MAEPRSGSRYHRDREWTKSEDAPRPHTRQRVAEQRSGPQAVTETENGRTAKWFTGCNRDREWPNREVVHGTTETGNGRKARMLPGRTRDREWPNSEVVHRLQPRQRMAAPRSGSQAVTETENGRTAKWFT